MSGRLALSGEGRAKWRGLVTALAIAMLSVVLPGGAQDREPQLQAWLGCWVPIGPLGDGAALCFQPAAAGEGVEMLVVADGGVTAREIIRGVGERRATGREGCEGWEEARLSPDGKRMYTRSTLTCADGHSRSATGIMSFVTPTQWMDVRSTYVGAERVASAQYFQRASTQVFAEAGVTPLPDDVAASAAAARLAASVPPSLDHVMEASRQVHGKAVEAWIVETGQPFRLNGQALVGLADAGVPESVIDAVVAVSFPRKFAIDRGVAQEVAQPPPAPSAAVAAGVPLPFSPLYFGFGYSYLYRYGYPGYGYGYNPNFWYPGYRPIYVTVTPRPPRTARVVNGRGYTKGSSRLPTGTTSGLGRGSVQRSGGSYQPAGGSGSGSGSTGRKAKRRRPGGDEP
jgi:hypothetical protein